MRTAAHTLRARGLVGWDETQRPCINPAVSEMLLDYAHPRYTLFGDTSVASTRVIPFFYIVGKQAIYEQCQPEPDVVQLRILSQEELWKRLYPDLRQEEPSEEKDPDGVGSPFTSPSNQEPHGVGVPFTSPSTQGQIIQSILNEGVKLAREDQERASQLFSNSLPQPLAEKLAAAYHKPLVVQYIARWEQVPTQKHPTPDAALTILQGPEQSFLLWVEELHKGKQAPVAVHLAANNLLQTYITQVLPPCMS
ncbi:MAG: hypothetical protein JO011_20880 [Ktedonobacteraceae bacterium]|nr:hypothetical protein [Ktedonobacteraceae bacterium]